MPDKKISIWRTVDWFTVILYVIMITAGWISIYGASYNFDNPSFFDTLGRSEMQLVWIGISVFAIFIIMMLDKNFFETLSFPIYGIIVLLLIFTIFFAPDIKGSRSWLVITSTIRLQPAEFAKFATALALARFMNTYEFDLLKGKNFILSMLFVLVPMACVILQKEAGTALVFLAFALVFYREGMSGYALLISVCAALFFVIIIKYEPLIWNDTSVGELAVSCIILVIVLFMLRFVLKEVSLSNYFFYITAGVSAMAYIATLYFEYNLVWVVVALILFFSVYLTLFSLKKIVWKYALLAFFAVGSIIFLFSADYIFNEVVEPHQQQRVKVTLGIENDPTGAGYNVKQSMIAIGSGGFSGKGFLNGTQTKLKYVPEQDTDFIFCTVGEEFGFLGSLFVLVFYGMFLLRLIYVAERQDTTFGRVYGYGVMSIFLFHGIVNIGMVTGLLPVIGIPLPFFSYGGSSLLGSTILLFILLRIDSGRKEGG
jgi:Bacterial cell division membrane protein